MCFVYNENTLRWVAWGPQSELLLIKPDGHFSGVDCDRETTPAPTITTTPPPTTTIPPTTTPPPLPTGCPNLMVTCGSRYNEVLKNFYRPTNTQVLCIIPLDKQACQTSRTSLCNDWCISGV